jgi:hypothetical protein
MIVSKSVVGTEVMWEKAQKYGYLIEYSTDNKYWYTWTFR